MIRCVRIWTSLDGNSDFEEGYIALASGPRDDVLSAVAPTQSISFRETQAGGEFQWHDAPTRQLVITLSGTLEFETHSRRRFTITPGDILLAEDTRGSGHRWSLIGEAPWRRAYVIVAPETAVPFLARGSAS
jgi:AraC-like ligand binding domain